MNTEIKNKILLYHEKDKIKKEADKVLKPLNLEIKSYMVENGLEKEIVDNVVVTLSIQERASTNDAKLLIKLKELGFIDAIKTIEIPDEQAVEQLLYEGKLTPIEVEDCIEVKKIEVLKIMEKKTKKV